MTPGPDSLDDLSAEELEAMACRALAQTIAAGCRYALVPVGLWAGEDVPALAVQGSVMAVALAAGRCAMVRPELWAPDTGSCWAVCLLEPGHAGACGTERVESALVALDRQVDPVERVRRRYDLHRRRALEALAMPSAQVDGTLTAEQLPLPGFYGGDALACAHPEARPSLRRAWSPCPECGARLRLFRRALWRMVG